MRTYSPTGRVFFRPQLRVPEALAHAALMTHLPSAAATLGLVDLEERPSTMSVTRTFSASLFATTAGQKRNLHNLQRRAERQRFHYGPFRDYPPRPGPKQHGKYTVQRRQKIARRITRLHRK